MTGSYHNYFRIFDVDSPNDIVLQADKSAFKAKKMGGPGGMSKGGPQKNGMRPGGLKEQMNLETLDFNKKILHGSWHPRENTIAVSPFRLLDVVYFTYRLCYVNADRSNEQLVPVQRGLVVPMALEGPGTLES